jgi:hypothetical protein
MNNPLPPSINDERVCTGFSLAPRRAHDDTIIWLRKYYYIQRFIYSRFEDFTTLGSKVLIGGQPAPIDILFSGACHRQLMWTTIEAFRTEAELLAYQKAQSHHNGIWADELYQLVKNPGQKGSADEGK